MANWTNENGDEYSGRTWSVGNAITAARWVYAQVLRLFRDGKAWALPGECSTAVEITAESGGTFFIADVVEHGTPITNINASNYGGVTSNDFSSTGYGMRNRVVRLRLWVDVAADAATAATYLPGGASETTPFSADGSAPDVTRGQWLKSGQGAGTSYDIVHTFGGGETLTVYLSDDDLKASYNNGGGANNACSIIGFIDVSPAITGA